jgi:hypothetical protein
MLKPMADNACVIVEKLKKSYRKYIKNSNAKVPVFNRIIDIGIAVIIESILNIIYIMLIRRINSVM